MFTINDDLSIYATRGDIVFFSVTAEDKGEPYTFKGGDVVRIKVFAKKDAESVVLQKDFPVTTNCEAVEIFLTEQDTKIGEVISKPKDYWYEIELNPLSDPQTIVGYDEDGAKVFRLFPEGRDLTELEPDVKPEDIPIIDNELDLTSKRPVENRAVARAISSVKADFEDTKEDVEEKTTTLKKDLEVERARINKIVALPNGSTTGDAELQDIRVGADGASHDSAGDAVRNTERLLLNALSVPVEWVEGQYFYESGGIASYSQFEITDYIPLRHNQVKHNLEITVYLNSSTYCILYDEDKNILGAINGDASEVAEKKIYTAITPECEYIRLSNHIDYAPRIVIADMYNSVIDFTEANEYAEKVNSVVVKNVFKNLYDVTSATIGKILIANTGAFYDIDGGVTSDYIPIESGEKYTFNAELSSYGSDLAQLTAYYDEDKNYIGCIAPVAYEESGSIITKTVIFPNNAKYTRFSYLDGSGNQAFMFVKGDKYPDFDLEYGIEYLVFTDTAIEAIKRTSNGSASRLNQKTIIWNGDSICAGKAFNDTKDAWAGRIATENGMAYKNYAASGGTITENVSISGGTVHSVSQTVDKMYEEYPDADYVIFEGGTNDADLLGNMIGDAVPERLGDISYGNYSGNYDKNTFCGALESIFYRATQYWKGKKIGFIVAQKMGRTLTGYSAAVNNRRAYFEKAIQICEKWGVPLLNLWDSCYLNPMLPHFYDTEKTSDENCAGGSMYADGQHLTSAGYDFTAKIIEAWLKSL